MPQVGRLAFVSVFGLTATSPLATGLFAKEALLERPRRDRSG